ncbi:broad substrate specificity ATP-binding cassette transporter ABCG2-like [Sciurus carolinensis]|uniref:broad substrate specificity ATP-binding cassette transporter ABCG2-like n=1 Tax=Sciurus carolinensis TaxID=30640 RepID=UPI001FB44635|nr:broad substrate specificity ATP-binding cassette transporter ABCG2-like [Sciurus carolinensis]
MANKSQFFRERTKLVVETFFIMIFTLMMVAFSSISMTLAVAAGHSDINFQRCVMNVYFAFTMIFLGLSILKIMTPNFQWLQYFSIPYYGFTALQHNEFWGRNFCPSLNTTHGNICPGYVICSGEEFLKTNGYLTGI